MEPTSREPLLSFSTVPLLKRLISGTIGGNIAGVAKKVNLVAIKALGDDGSGRQSDIVQAIDLATSDAVRNNRIAVINMSLGGSASAAIDAAVTRAVAQGVTVVVAAGNESENALNSSPARVANAITVGASDINDNMASFSNFGPAVDILAPGVAIFSASIANDRAAAFLDGTSMASPHVAGLAAVVLSEEGRAAPAVVKQRVLQRGVQNRLKQIGESSSFYCTAFLKLCQWVKLQIFFSTFRFREMSVKSVIHIN